MPVMIINSIGIPRIYSKLEDRPGLAISRSLGDIFGHTVGVSCVPEVSYKELDDSDKFIVIGSDGIWDVMNSSEVVGYIFTKSENGRDRIADDVLEECRIRWEVFNKYSQKMADEKSLNLMKNDINSTNKSFTKNKSKNIIIDDITAVICFFNTD
jgi:serine/threonine protein phosphatase PrpC